MFALAQLSILMKGLSEYYEEKTKAYTEENGAFSRIDFENEETVLFLSFNPDDLLSPAVLNLSNFADSVCMQECKVKVFAGEDSPDYKIIE